MYTDIPFWWEKKLLAHKMSKLKGWGGPDSQEGMIWALSVTVSSDPSNSHPSFLYHQ